MVLTGAAGAGLFIMIAGIIAVVVGVILYEMNVQNKKKQPWWVWLIIGLGVLFSVIGAIMTISFMRKVPQIQTVPNTTTPT